MTETLKNLKPLADKSILQRPDTDVCAEYKQTRNPVILATYFESYYNFTYSQMLKYNMNSNDAASISLVRLDECLLSFDEDKNCSLFSFYVRAVTNGFKNDLKSRLADKRIADNSCTSLDSCLTNTEDCSLYDLLSDPTSYVHFQDIDFINSIDKLPISPQEKKIVHMICEQGMNASEVAEILGNTVSYVHKALKAIGRKCVAVGIYNF